MSDKTHRTCAQAALHRLEQRAKDAENGDDLKDKAKKAAQELDNERRLTDEKLRRQITL